MRSTAEDWVALQQLWSEYSYCCDAPDYDALADLFTEDIVWSRTGGAMSATFVGIDEVMHGLTNSVLEAQSGDPSQLHPAMHVMGNPSLRLSANTAIGHWYLVSFRHTDLAGACPVRTCGQYTVDFVRRREVWKIQRVSLAMYWTSTLGRLVEDVAIPS